MVIPDVFVGLSMGLTQSRLWQSAVTASCKSVMSQEDSSLSCRDDNLCRNLSAHKSKQTNPVLQPLSLHVPKELQWLTGTLQAVLSMLTSGNTTWWQVWQPVMRLAAYPRHSAALWYWEALNVTYCKKTLEHLKDIFLKCLNRQGPIICRS